jgi:hypothetical protein
MKYITPPILQIRHSRERGNPFNYDLAIGIKGDLGNKYHRRSGRDESKVIYCHCEERSDEAIFQVPIKSRKVPLVKWGFRGIITQILRYLLIILLKAQKNKLINRHCFHQIVENISMFSTDDFSRLRTMPTTKVVGCINLGLSMTKNLGIKGTHPVCSHKTLLFAAIPLKVRIPFYERATSLFPLYERASSLFPLYERGLRFFFSFPRSCFLISRSPAPVWERNLVQ